MEIRSVLDFPDVSFIDNMTIEDIQSYYLDAMKKKYKEMTGNELVMKEADPIRLLSYSNCLLLYQIAQYAERAGKMALLKYSYGDYLENIGALKGITRLQGAAAVTRMRFTLADKRPGTTIIPGGTRVTASDGVYFCTSEVLEIPAGSLTGEVNAQCRDIGIKGNDYKIGDLKTLVDPVPYVDKVENMTIPEGGADRETDENLAERIYLAPSSWSTAGPDDAYKYWVKSFDPAITDVRVDSDIPGEVDICFIMQEGELPEDTLIEEVEKFLMDENIRPLTDYVIIHAPDEEEYGIDFTYYINRSDRAKAAQIHEQVQESVREYILWQKKKIGRDVNPDQLRKLLISAGAKRLEIRAPDFRKVPKKSIALLQGDAIVIYGGIEDD